MYGSNYKCRLQISLKLNYFIFIAIVSQSISTGKYSFYIDFYKMYSDYNYLSVMVNNQLCKESGFVLKQKHIRTQTKTLKPQP